MTTKLVYPLYRPMRVHAHNLFAGMPDPLVGQPRLRAGYTHFDIELYLDRPPHGRLAKDAKSKLNHALAKEGDDGAKARSALAEATTMLDKPSLTFGMRSTLYLRIGNFILHSNRERKEKTAGRATRLALRELDRCIATLTVAHAELDDVEKRHGGGAQVMKPRLEHDILCIISWFVFLGDPIKDELKARIKSIEDKEDPVRKDLVKAHRLIAHREEIIRVAKTDSLNHRTAQANRGAALEEFEDALPPEPKR